MVVLQLEVLEVEAGRVSVGKGLPHDSGVIVDLLSCPGPHMSAQHLFLVYFMLVKVMADVVSEPEAILAVLA